MGSLMDWCRELNFLSTDALDVVIQFGSDFWGLLLNYIKLWTFIRSVYVSKKKQGHLETGGALPKTNLPTHNVRQIRLPGYNSTPSTELTMSMSFLRATGVKTKRTMVGGGSNHCKILGLWIMIDLNFVTSWLEIMFTWFGVCSMYGYKQPTNLSYQGLLKSWGRTGTAANLKKHQAHIKHFWYLWLLPVLISRNMLFTSKMFAVWVHSMVQPWRYVPLLINQAVDTARPS